jgi:type 2 lantibiotic biosynthesis protein LanM
VGAADRSIVILRKSEIEDRARYRSLTLSERKQLRQRTDFEPLKSSGDLARAQRRLDRWRKQPPFDVEGNFQDRLSLEELDEEELLALLLESEIPPTAVLAEVTPWFDKIQEIYHADPAPVSEAIGEKAGPPRPVERFSAILDPLISEARRRLRDKVSGLDVEPIIFYSPDNGFFLFLDLRQQLWLALNRALVLELNVARLEGSLRGTTPEERFEAFTQRFAEAKYCCSFYAEYPVLARLVIGMVDRAIEGRLEFIARLRNDWEQIRLTFSQIDDAGRVVDVGFGAGDLHCGGRSVAILTFDSGARLVYKPKPLGVVRHFQQFLQWLRTKDERVAYRPLGILDRETYGWEEFVASKPCSSEEEVRRFYWRQGSYLAVLHCLAGTDIHYQNLIAAGDDPVLVDLETLFHPPLPYESDEHPAFVLDAIRSSVLAVGLLPVHLRRSEDGPGFDSSGLGGGSERLSATPVAHWEDALTDRMRIVRKHAKVSQGANRAVLDGRDTIATDYGTEIRAGFSEVYRTFLFQKDVLGSDAGPLNDFAGDRTRVVFRSTRVYGDLLSQSYHPDYLRDALDRQRFFDQLWVGVSGQSFLRRVIRIESDDLFQGDIPLFGARAGSSDLFAGPTQTVEDFFPEPALSVVRRRINNLSERDLQQQLALIEGSLVAGAIARSDLDPAGAVGDAGAMIEQPPLAGKDLHDSALQAAIAIGDRLLALAIEGPNGQASWISLLRRKRDNRWQLAGLGEDLYLGLPGVIFYLAYLDQVTGNTLYRELTESSLRTLLASLPKYLERNPKVGAFDGVGGIIYLLTHLGVLWRRADLLERAHGILPLLSTLIDEDPHFDIITGAAGCAACVMCLHEHSPSEETLAVLEKCGDRLVQQAQDVGGGKAWLTVLAPQHPLTGFSHGNAGIAWALCRLADLVGNEGFRHTAFAAIEYEHRLFLPEAGNWPDYREGRVWDHGGPTAGQLISAWCHGATGIGLGRLYFLGAYDLEVARIDVARAVTRTLADPLLPNHSLCHGSLGSLDFLIQAATLVELPAREIENRTSGILRSIESDGWQCGVPRGAEVPGLMRGLAGIGYGLLRAVLPSRIPSILTLDAPRKEKNSAA